MAGDTILDTVLLIALPASGKSEVRRYLRHVSPEVGAAEFHLGEQVQLDDFPYVHFMREVDEALEACGAPRRFYASREDTFAEGRDWGTLLHLVNEDYAVISDPSTPLPGNGAAVLFERIDRARTKVGAEQVFAGLDAGLRDDLASRLHDEAVRLNDELFSNRPDSLDGRTVVIEFARGGPDGSGFPLPAPHGYRYSLAQLSPAILERATILYIWVEPEESRRKNRARANPDDPGSILHHGVPEKVMYGEYGCCDVAWLLDQSDRPDTVPVQAHGRTYNVPLARFDNRVDKTSFIRDEPSDWAEGDVRALHDGLAGALGRLWTASRA